MNNTVWEDDPDIDIPVTTCEFSKDKITISVDGKEDLIGKFKKVEDNLWLIYNIRIDGKLNPVEFYFRFNDTGNILYFIIKVDDKYKVISPPFYKKEKKTIFHKGKK
jgi:hypothetical protein